MDKDNPKPTPSPPQLQEGVDFYIEDGLYVFTEKYLGDRGYCCKNACRHCPYGYTAAIKLSEENPSK